MTAQNHRHPEAGIWQPEPGPELDTVMCSWLLEPGLLTARLRTQCGSKFRLQLVNESHSDEAELAIYRQVALCCSDEPCIYAECRIPMNTANAHFWLRDLGNEPLGERLLEKENVSRSAFEYAWLLPDVLPEWIRAFAKPDSHQLWARRSEFFISDHSLEVTEYFLPGVIGCAD
ncbi:MAG: chorismate--pyruvate lyase family protein [Gammaproteobacteria bacterium]